MNLIDSLLSRLTMYRLMLFYLVTLAITSLFFSDLNPVDIIAQTLFLLLTCYLANLAFSKIFKVPTNFESFAITALILSLIIGPFTPRSLGEVGLLATIATLAMASKYLLVIHKRHLFNPAAIAVVISAVLFHQNASWWIGSQPMFPFLLLGGLIILRKIRRFSLAFIFLLITVILSTSLPNFLSPSLIFFASVMLVEPQTSPVSTKLQLVYGALIAGLFTFLPVSYPLELSLLLGNLFTFLVEPTSRYLLRLEHKLKLSPDTYAFYFQPDSKLNFSAGQYLELTLSHPHSDNRGTRRFFTIASSPTEPEAMIISRFVPVATGSSSFKNTLLNMTEGQTIFANGPSGEFVLPHATSHMPLAFIAGGVGITPFRSMVKFLLDTNQSANITLLYLAKTTDDFIEKDIFLKAEKLGIKTIYETASVSSELIKKNIPDYQSRLFYVSGPELMVKAVENILREIKVPGKNIRRDYFPGY